MGKFDPSRFIQAERAAAELSQASQVSQPRVADADGFVGLDKGYDFREFRAGRDDAVAKSQLSQPSPPEFPWSDGLVTLRQLRRPTQMRQYAWDRLVWTAITLSSQWGQRAVDLGWSPLDLYGCNPQPFARRIDRDGLAIGLAAHDLFELVDLTAEYAVMQDPRGSVLKHYRRPRPGQTFIWTAFAFCGGP